MTLRNGLKKQTPSGIAMYMAFRNSRFSKQNVDVISRLALKKAELLNRLGPEAANYDITISDTEPYKVMSSKTINTTAYRTDMPLIAQPARVYKKQFLLPGFRVDLQQDQVRLVTNVPKKNISFFYVPSFGLLADVGKYTPQRLIFTNVTGNVKPITFTVNDQYTYTFDNIAGSYNCQYDAFVAAMFCFNKIEVKYQDGSPIDFCVQSFSYWKPDDVVYKVFQGSESLRAEFNPTSLTTVDTVNGLKLKSMDLRFDDLKMNYRYPFKFITLKHGCAITDESFESGSVVHITKFNRFDSVYSTYAFSNYPSAKTNKRIGTRQPEFPSYIGKIGYFTNGIPETPGMVTPTVPLAIATMPVAQTNVVYKDGLMPVSGVPFLNPNTRLISNYVDNEGKIVLSGTILGGYFGRCYLHVMQIPNVGSQTLRLKFQCVDTVDYAKPVHFVLGGIVEFDSVASSTGLHELSCVIPNPSVQVDELLVTAKFRDMEAPIKLVFEELHTCKPVNLTLKRLNFTDYKGDNGRRSLKTIDPELEGSPLSQWNGQRITLDTRHIERPAYSRTLYPFKRMYFVQKRIPNTISMVGGLEVNRYTPDEVYQSSNSNFQFNTELVHMAHQFCVTCAEIDNSKFTLTNMFSDWYTCSAIYFEETF